MAAHSPVKIDLLSKSSLGDVQGYTTTSFLNGIWMKPFDNNTKCYLPLNNEGENAVYELDYSSNSVKKVFATTGAVTSLEAVIF